MRHLRWPGTMLLAAALVASAASLSLAEPLRSGANNSFHSRMDRFAASVKAQTERAAAVSERAVERTEQTVITFKDRMRTHVESVGAALSEQKAKFATLNRDAATTLDSWMAVAVQSWAKMQRSTAETLERIAAWMRNQSETEEQDGTHV